MHVKELSITSNTEVVRRIPFHLGANLIVDYTEGKKDVETGNNIGKTTVLALIDYCLGGNADQIYKDPETKRDIQYVKDYLEDYEILITLTLKEDLSDLNSKEITISRNFLKRNKKIMSINGKNYLKEQGKEFLKVLSKCILGDRESEKPSFRQIIAHNIRYKDNKIDNTLKFLNTFTTSFEYETLFLYMLGLPVADRSHLNSKIKTEQEYRKRLEKEYSKTEAKFQLEIVKNTIKNLETKKNTLNINETYEDDLHTLNQIRLRISSFSSRISELTLKRNLLIETQNELKKEISTIDINELREIYSTAKKEVDNIQTTFEKMVEYHNNMVVEKIRFIVQDIPKLDEEINHFNHQLKQLLADEKNLAKIISQSDTFQDFEKIIERLTHEYQKYGELNSFIEQVEKVEGNISSLNDDISILDNNRFSKEFENKLTEKLVAFNDIFANVSEDLYGEKYGITYVIKEDKKTKQNYYHFESFNANSSSGKKQGEIICFDIAYIIYARNISIPQLEFLLNDKKELMHGNQLNTVSEYAKNKKIQLVFSILKDKLPVDLNNKDHIVLELSDFDKLFKIEASDD